jgi:PAS domain S-box-containing protein
MTDAGLQQSGESRETLLFLREAEKIARIGIWAANPETDHLYWSDGVNDILGAPPDYKPRLAEGLRVFDPEGIPAFETALRRCLADGTPFVLQIGFSTLSGEHRWSEVRGLRRVEQHEAPFILGTFLDITERRATELALREREELFSSIVGQAMDSIALVDAVTFRFVEFNRAAHEGLGYTRDEFSRLTVMDIQAEHSPALIRANTQEAVDHGGVVFETTHRARDGAIREVRVSLRPLVIRGRPFAAVVWTDVTERNRAEAQLRFQKDVLEETGRIAQVGGFWFDAATGEGDWTDEVARIHDETPGQPIWRDKGFEYYTDGSKAAIKAAVARCVEEGVPYDLELEIVSAKGIRKWVRTIGHPEFKEGGGTLVRGSFQDITGHKKTHEALQIRNALLSAQQEVSLDGILVVDRNRRILSHNRRFVELWGVPKALVESGDDQPVLQHVVSLVADPETFKERIEYLNTHETEIGQDEVGLADGRVFERHSAPLQGEDGRYLGRVWHFRDVSERRQMDRDRARAEMRLRQSQKMEALGTLAGGIAHDFNNILAIIYGYAEIASGEAGAGSPVREELQEVLRAADRARDLVQQILAFSRQTEQEKRPTQIGLIVKEAMKMLRASLPSTIDIRSRIDSRAVVMADATQIHQVLMNLCTNAAHAMRDNGGFLEVSLQDVRLDVPVSSFADLEPGSYLRLTVKDTGHGIDPAIVDRIFDPFFTTKEKGAGTGLGLAVVHGIVESHGGSIEVESAPGRGTTFHVYFPTVAAAAPAAERRAADVPRGSERILVVDDEKVIATILSNMLRSLGYDVEARTNAVEALEAVWSRLESRPFDLVITDMTMPVLTGAKLAEELFLLDRRPAIVLCTGFSETMDQESAKALGVEGFLMKPFTMHALAATVRRVLDEWAEREGRRSP